MASSCVLPRTGRVGNRPGGEAGGVGVPRAQEMGLGTADQPGPGPLGPSRGTPVEEAPESYLASAHTGPVPAVSASTCHGPRPPRPRSRPGHSFCFGNCMCPWAVPLPEQEVAICGPVLGEAPHCLPCLHPEPPLGPCGSSRRSPRPCASRLQFILCAFRGNLPKMSILSHPLSQNCKPSWAAPSAPCAPARNEVRCVRNQRLPEPLGARLRCIIVSRLLLLASTDWIFQDGDLRFVKRELRGESAGGLC